MKFRRLCLALSLFGVALGAQADSLRVITHSSFEVSKPLLADFEKQTGIQVELIKAGDAGEMLNKLILTRANPIADVVFGLDNSLAGKAEEAGVIAPSTLKSDGRKARYSLPGGLVSTDYGYVTLVYDKAWFAKHNLPLPKSLADLTLPAYRDLLVVENPATSSPGQAFLFSTIHAMGEERAFAFWRKLRGNGVKVVKDWGIAYNTDFSHNGGGRPIVLSYATDPAAEVAFSKVKITESPVGTLPLPGAVYQQIEGAGLIQGGHERAAAEKFIAFLRSKPVQQDLQTQMWMYPVMQGTPLAPVFSFAKEPAAHQTPSAQEIRAKGQDWVKRWTQVVLK
ncbi:MAG: thiamine ABC transporter substrate-binding protein [Paludibacterium sp.]|uniref:thiamine ABC transporter substrate-binding protein n=1 Tax=Paludibacterium sp. TaxID=1917523 RepID=UPI0025E7422E|nr:thiamine ABC transporter substrate-binding protein [Paludibacterium sp.]MBV8048502.1 thiamine ABC transporter substrate-binding protein [Paludibacterium sp.]MBV8647362.1 thiamine ABC transporter substrate-binding protein [Paludibacterium sp.]